jgi:hypothetical protein
MGCRLPTLALQSSDGRSRPFRRSLRRRNQLALEIVARRLNPRSLGSSFGRRQFHAGTPRLRQTNCDGLSCGTSAMLTFFNMLDLFVYKLPSLRCRGFALACIFSGSLEDDLFFRHMHRCDCYGSYVSVKEIEIQLECLKYWTARSCFSAALLVLNVPRFFLRPELASFLRE